MVIYCILTGLAVYYIALWLWYRYTDSRTSTGKADDAPLPQNKVSSYTLVGESRYKGGLIGTAQDKSGHLPQTAGNDTIFAPQVDDKPEESTSDAAPEADETPGYENDNPTEAEKRQAAGTLAGIEGTNLYDAVVENINGGAEKVAELLGRNEAELATSPTSPETANVNNEYEAFNMNEFL